ncbi:ribonuclease catalytic domain-containing protein, partial [Patescibacteria group bacterium]
MAYEYQQKIRVSIDPEDSKDIDDIWCLESDGLGWILHVEIADVASQVPLGSKHDQVAFQKGYTHYFDNGDSDPIFPIEMAEGSMSLFEATTRDVMTISMPIGRSLAYGERVITSGRVPITRNLTYAQADTILSSSSTEYHEYMTRAMRLAQKLYEQRRNDGALEEFDAEYGVPTMTGQGWQVFGRRQNFNSILIVQEFMIPANITVAKFIRKHGERGLFRNHTARVVIDETLSDMSGASSDEMIQRERQNRIAMGQNRATYDPVNVGHYGLNLPEYTHCTSPIRRYVDVVIQRIVHAILENQPNPYVEDQLADIGAKLTRLEWEIKSIPPQELKRQRYLRVVARNGKLNTLPAQTILLMTKLASREEWMTHNLEREIMRRTGKNGLDPRIAYQLLFKNYSSDGAWIRLKECALRWLERHPQHAASLLSFAMTDNRYDTAKYEIEKTINGGGERFSATVSTNFDDKPEESDEVTSGTVKGAKQLAATNLIGKIVREDIESLRKERLNERFQQAQANPSASDNGT